MRRDRLSPNSRQMLRPFVRSSWMLRTNEKNRNTSAPIVMATIPSVPHRPTLTGAPFGSSETGRVYPRQAARKRPRAPDAAARFRPTSLGYVLAHTLEEEEDQCPRRSPC